MKRKKCISCGSFVIKSGFYDPYLCRSCENSVNFEMRDRYIYIDGF